TIGQPHQRHTHHIPITEQQWPLPPWQRRQWPLLFRDGDVVSVPLVGLADGEDSDNSERWYLLPSTAMSH
ncbi:TilS substrate C-terminal domain-containing protein, partial [Alcanivorax sp. HI0044]|uniref:TilS substrate C-terminal domain-containing protein n=1 Tax=Alcanivorax sp. HI0044 TaxID=1822234 RepID=UPI0026F45C01